MIENLLKSEHTINEFNGESLFESHFDYDSEVEKRQIFQDKWRELEALKKEQYSNKIERFLSENGCIDLNSKEAKKAKNLSLLQKEIKSTVFNDSNIKALDISELHFSSSLLELLENTENTAHVRELYRLRKRNTNQSRKSGITEHEAQRIKNCMRQGRELYLSGLNGPLMVKPLNFFYSLTAYSYAIIILNNPIKYKLDSIPGSHGLNYLPDYYKSQVGGSIKQGTFSDLFSSFHTSIIHNQNFYIAYSNEDSIRAFYKKTITASVGLLLSMVPEIREYYELVSGENSRSHPLTITSVPSQRGLTWQFAIGDGQRRPDPNDIANSFGHFRSNELYGKTIIEIPSTEAHKIKATIIADIRGDLWYIENPFFPIVLPEICIHFLLSNAFSNIMRYSPDMWGDVLLNEINSDISLIIRKYLSAFESKLPLALLRAISKFTPSIA